MLNWSKETKQLKKWGTEELRNSEIEELKNWGTGEWKNEDLRNWGTEALGHWDTNYTKLMSYGTEDLMN